MYRNATEPSFFITNCANRRQGGIYAHNARMQRCSDTLASNSGDPLDMLDQPLPKRRRRRKDAIMTGEEFRDARGRLGRMWGLDRPLTLTEFGRVLRLGGVRPDQSVRDYERGKTQVSGPMSVLIELLLAGARPHNLNRILGSKP